MSNDSKASDPSGRGTAADSSAVPATPATTTSAADTALNFIGYEAADPSLQSAFWTETQQTGAPPRSLR
jgi:hypothetical protein